MTSLAHLQNELAELLNDIATFDEVLESLPDEPDMLPMKTEAMQMKADSLQQKQLLESKIALEKAGATAGAPPPPPPPTPLAPPPPPAPLFDPAQHPILRNAVNETAATKTDAPTIIFNVGDHVQAKYATDGMWYTARITSKTGSSQNPMYTVIYPEYKTTETLLKENVRPLHDQRKQNLKRKADGTAAANEPAAQRNGPVISAPAKLDPTLVATAKREPSKVSDGPMRAKPAKNKLPNQKPLDNRRNNWQTWQAKGPKAPVIGSVKAFKQESQFRTPDRMGAKVGFTGSGRAMTKDVKRVRASYDTRGDDDAGD